MRDKYNRCPACNSGALAPEVRFPHALRQCGECSKIFIIQYKIEAQVIALCRKQQEVEYESIS